MNYKHFFLFGTVALASLLTFSACNKDDVKTPSVDEPELITTLRLDVTGSSGTQSFKYKVENGIGSTTPGTIQIDTVKLSPNTTYSVAVAVLNEKAQPVENTTDEIIGEKDEHLFFLSSDPASGAGSLSVSGGSLDNNGKPFNQTFTMNTGAAGSGAFTVTLIHQPTNKEATSTAGAGGETDAEGVFPVKLQ